MTQTQTQIQTLAQKIAAHEGAMKAEQLAKLLNVSRLTVERRARKGKIPCFRVGI
jgi:hypothetical protein